MGVKLVPLPVRKPKVTSDGNNTCSADTQREQDFPAPFHRRILMASGKRRIQNSMERGLQALSLPTSFSGKWDGNTKSFSPLKTRLVVFGTGDDRSKSARGLAQSGTLPRRSAALASRSVPECGSPLPLFAQRPCASNALPAENQHQYLSELLRQVVGNDKA